MTQNWHPMWGLWLVAEAQQQQAAGQPANGQPQSHTKSDFFLQNNSNDRTTWQSGWQANSSSALHHHKAHRRSLNSVPHHHKAHRRPCQLLKGSAQLTSGDVGGDAEAQDQFSPKAIDPVREGVLSSLSQKSRHQKIEGATGDRGEENRLHSELFVVPGAQNFVKMLKASNFTYSAWCTELCISAWGTLWLKCHCDWISWCWISQVRLLIFTILLCHCPTPNWSRGITFFAFFNLQYE